LNASVKKAEPLKKQLSPSPYQGEGDKGGEVTRGHNNNILKTKGIPGKTRVFPGALRGEVDLLLRLTSFQRFQWSWSNP